MGVPGEREGKRWSRRRRRVKKAWWVQPGLPLISSRYITQQGNKLETGKSRVPPTVTNAVSWRSEGIKYKKNEVFIDVIESVNLLVSPQGCTTTTKTEAEQGLGVGGASGKGRAFWVVGVAFEKGRVFWVGQSFGRLVCLLGGGRSFGEWGVSYKRRAGL